MFDIYLPIAEVFINAPLLLLISSIVGLLTGMLGIGGGFLKYILSLVYENIEITKYFKKLFLPFVRMFLNDEPNKKLAFPIGYYIKITKKLYNINY